jgi:hypothetical protein
VSFLFHFHHDRTTLLLFLTITDIKKYLIISAMKKMFTILVGVSSLIVSCSKRDGGGDSGAITGGGNNTAACASIPKTFAADVNPIIQSICNMSGCHNNGSINGPGPLTNYDQVFAARVSIRAAIASGTMPQNTTLSVAQKNSFICWIDSGAPNN